MEGRKINRFKYLDIVLQVLLIVGLFSQILFAEDLIGFPPEKLIKKAEINPKVETNFHILYKKYLEGLPRAQKFAQQQGTYTYTSVKSY